MTKKILLTIILGMFLLAMPLASSISELNNVKQGECVNLFQYCNDCTYVNWTGMEYPNGTIDTNINEAMTKNNLNYNYTYCGVNETGNYKYFVTGDKGGIIQQEEIHFEVNLSGKEVDITEIISRAFLIILFGTLIFFIYSSTSKINFEKWYKKVKSNYEHKNYVKLSLGAISYQLMKNRWVIFYIIGFLIMMLLMDITYLFNIESLFETMKIITFIYTWSFIIVGLVFLSYLQEFFKMILEQIEDANWGGSYDK